MPKIEQDKSILIFADGTGNEGGLLPDESRTNVYKLYRATRVDPESKIDPEKQIAFYIRGIGTIIPGKSSIIRQLNDNLAQMFGNGFEDRLIQCFTAVISVWKPGDRIYLFEFSRGAYIVRCLAHLLERLGIPTQESSRRQLSLDPRKLRPIAKSGVRIYYRFGLTTKDDEAKDKRAREWCKVHNSQMDAVPYFVGVWDTVAAMGWERLFPSRYEKHLPPVMFVRHAMAIDEYRKDFARAAWGSTHTMRPPVQGEPLPFKQVWFAGNHADIGGSYPENESRLSDITLDWIAGFVSKDLPEPCRVCVSKRFLNLHPSCRGMMHDECMAGKIHWSKKVRAVDQHGELHQLRQISSSSSAQF